MLAKQLTLQLFNNCLIDLPSRIYKYDRRKNMVHNSTCKIVTHLLRNILFVVFCLLGLAKSWIEFYNPACIRIYCIENIVWYIEAENVKNITLSSEVTAQMVTTYSRKTLSRHTTWHIKKQNRGKRTVDNSGRMNP